MDKDKEFSLWEMEKRKQELGSLPLDNAQSQPESSESSNEPAGQGEQPVMEPHTHTHQPVRSHVSYTKMADLWQTSAAKQDIDVHKFWEVIKRYKLIIAIITITICGVNVFYTYKQPDKYRTETTIRINNQTGSTQSNLDAGTLKSELGYPQVTQNAADRLNFRAKYYLLKRQFEPDGDLFDKLCEEYVNEKSIRAGAGVSERENVILDAILKFFGDNKDAKRKWAANIAGLPDEQKKFYSNAITDKELQNAETMSAGEIGSKISGGGSDREFIVHIIAQDENKNLIAPVANAVAEGLIDFHKNDIEIENKEAHKQINEYNNRINVLQNQRNQKIDVLQKQRNEKTNLIRQELFADWKQRYPDRSEDSLQEILDTNKVDDLISEYQKERRARQEKFNEAEKNLKIVKNKIENYNNESQPNEVIKPLSDAEAEKKADKFAKINLEIEYGRDPKYLQWIQKKIAIESDILTYGILYKKDYPLAQRKEQELKLVKDIIDAPLEKEGSLRQEVFTRLKSTYKYQLLNQAEMSPELKMMPDKITNDFQNLISSRSSLEQQKSSYYADIENYKQLCNAAIERRNKIENNPDVNKIIENNPEMAKISENIQILEEKRKQFIKKESDTESESTVGLSVLNPARSPDKPVGPNREISILIGLLVGLVIAFGIAFLLEYLDNTIKTPLDIRRELNLTTLGIIPKWNKKDVFVVSPEDPKSIVAEVFSVLRNNIRYSSRLSPEKMLLIASAVKGEGKSYIASSLAISFSMEGARTILVNADMRKSGSYAGLEVQSGFKGLSDYLEGNAEINDVISSTNVPDLFFISNGHKVSHPAKVLRSEKMFNLLDELERRYDVVIIDVPAVLPVVDTSTFSNRVRAVLMVISAGESPSNAVKHAVDRLRHVKTPVVGAVLNNAVDTNVTSYYGDSYYYYDQEHTKLYHTIMKKLRGF